MAKQEKVYWNDARRTWAGTHVFGEEVTGLIDSARLKKFIEDGTVVKEKPVSVDEAATSKVGVLEKSLKVQAEKIRDLEAEIAATPKNITDIQIIVAELEESIVEKDDEIKKLNEDLDEATKKAE